MLTIPSNEIVYKERVGTCGKATLEASYTAGGLHLIEMRSPDGRKEVIGAGSHRAVARHLAKRKHPDLVWTVLEKSADPQLSDFEDVLGFWQEVVNRVNANR
jgi:hypothetical protein